MMRWDGQPGCRRLTEVDALPAVHEADTRNTAGALEHRPQFDQWAFVPRPKPASGTTHPNTTLPSVSLLLRFVITTACARMACRRIAVACAAGLAGLRLGRVTDTLRPRAILHHFPVLRVNFPALLFPAGLAHPALILRPLLGSELLL
ncbi:MAG: hypothetical protein OEV88_14900 [Gammaproteobacteria bacterium]|nr:hypothetical protein [Gammaproteobacteria bacterium]